MLDFVSENGIMALLKKEREIFHSEADFQFALAWAIKKWGKKKRFKIRLEMPFSENEKGKGFIDIVVMKGNEVYPIELKYPKKKLEGYYITRDKKFCHEKPSDSSFAYEYYKLNNGVREMDMYGCIRDIERLETFNRTVGYAVWLTNDSAYWSREQKVSNDTKPLYKCFHTPNGHVIHKGTTMKFPDPKKSEDKDGKVKTTPWVSSSNKEGKRLYPDITLNGGDYEIIWNPYSELVDNNGNKAEFKYTVIEVKKEG